MEDVADPSEVDFHGDLTSGGLLELPGRLGVVQQVPQHLVFLGTHRHGDPDGLGEVLSGQDLLQDFLHPLDGLDAVPALEPRAREGFLDGVGACLFQEFGQLWVADFRGHGHLQGAIVGSVSSRDGEIIPDKGVNVNN